MEKTMSIQNNLIVKDVMLDLESFPVINDKALLKEALEKMDYFGYGIACICNHDNELMGIITDGDIRRKLLSVQRPLPALFVDDAINQAIKIPITIGSNESLLSAVSLMDEKQVWDIPVINNNKLIGLLHLHPALKRLLMVL